MASDFRFTLIATDGAARLGEIQCAHGTVRTPAFMPVGTQATVKGVHPAAVRATGADIILGNTYHLMLRPGAGRIAALGGLHTFMNWPHPILTDSGGFQVMSLSELRKLDESGVTFRSHVDGAMVALSPERAIEIQNLLGSDIVMQLDECLKLPATRAEMERAMRLSLRWAERCKRERGDAHLFARVSESSRTRERDARGDAAVGNQSRLLPEADGRHARGDQRGIFRGFPGRDARGVGTRRYRPSIVNRSRTPRRLLV